MHCLSPHTFLHVVFLFNLCNGMETNAQLKEGDTVSIRCQQVESNCRKNFVCEVEF